MNQYQNRTSGILLESAFLGVVPVAPMELLKTNNIDGIGYRMLDEMCDKIEKCRKKSIIDKNRRKILNDYEERRIKTEFSEWIKHVI